MVPLLNCPKSWPASVSREDGIQNVFNEWQLSNASCSITESLQFASNLKVESLPQFLKQSLPILPTEDGIEIVSSDAQF
jgi:hypothetical protein